MLRRLNIEAFCKHHDPVATGVLKEIDVTEIRNQNAIGTENVSQRKDTGLWLSYHEKQNPDK